MTPDNARARDASPPEPHWTQFLALAIGTAYAEGIKAHCSVERGRRRIARRILKQIQVAERNSAILPSARLTEQHLEAEREKGAHFALMLAAIVRRDGRVVLTRREMDAAPADLGKITVATDDDGDVTLTLVEGDRVQ